MQMILVLLQLCRFRLGLNQLLTQPHDLAALDLPNQQAINNEDGEIKNA